MDSLEREHEVYHRHYSGLSFEARDIMNGTRIPANDIDVDDDDDIDFPILNVNDLSIFPPSEEALLQTHEEREYEEILSSLLAKSN
ncbi:hypothetical protein E1B28_011910 [Marasmius oreades]|uniref:Uncharacterized protein n=1 Tax=Marasmius oreades TaxID=181124 RepID=A0A9P7RV87_9AGAR|nr:uncharacterized protein E1B28_011910 [Marasmius oreades]KAG7090312.1 hypothetical protein E1B28_011910 [Marasmius oreades]